MDASGAGASAPGSMPVRVMRVRHGVLWREAWHAPQRYWLYAIVDNSASAACRESSRVCCTTIGTSALMTLA
jgi:hypothetical protein